MSADLLEVMVDAIEAAIDDAKITDSMDTSATGFRLVDKLDGAQQHGQPKLHLGVSVDVPNTRNANKLRGVIEAWVEDTVVVTLVCAIFPHDQKASRRQAYEHERTLRQTVTAVWQPNREWDPVYVGSARRKEGGWLIIEQSFQTRRFAPVGPAGRG